MLAKRQVQDGKRAKAKAGHLYQKHIEADDKDVSFESEEKQPRSERTSDESEGNESNANNDQMADRDAALELIKEKNSVFFETVDSIIAKTISRHMIK